MSDDVVLGEQEATPTEHWSIGKVGEPNRMGDCEACGDPWPCASASPGEPERCPRCGSDDPMRCNIGGWYHRFGENRRTPCCPDPWHGEQKGDEG